MKKLATIPAVLAYLLTAGIAFAQQTINLQRPHTATNQPLGFSDIGDFLNKLVTLIFIVAVIIVFIMLIWGAIQWIFSGGEKEAVAAARNRIIHALIGLAILAAAFAIFQLVGTFLGFQIGPQGATFTIPSPVQ